MQNVAKIADLGCSVNSDGPRKSCLGSLQYWSPEQVRRDEYDNKVDMWSLGVIAFELLFGYSPFQKEVESALKTKKVDGYGELSLPKQTSVSKEGVDFVMGLLQRDPKKRFTI